VILRKTLKTRYGLVDAKSLTQLREGFDTTRILQAVEALDQVRENLCETGQLRTDLLHLHGMAHDLINDAGSPSSYPAIAIWDLAENVEEELEEFATALREGAKAVVRLTQLAPDGEEQDEPGE
jgi:hypothetical protein